MQGLHHPPIRLGYFFLEQCGVPRARQWAGCWGRKREREFERERAASCWYSSSAAVPDEAAIFTHRAAFFSPGILSRSRASAPVQLSFSEHTVHECTQARLLVPGGQASALGLVILKNFLFLNTVIHRNHVTCWNCSSGEVSIELLL